MTRYLEHEKLKALEGKNDVVAGFLEWLSANEFVIARYHEHTDPCYDDEDDRVCGYNEDDLYPVRRNIESLMAEYFGISLTKLEDEKRAMLDEIRRHNP